MQHGLGGKVCTRNFPDAPPGVYLSATVTLAIAFLIEYSLDTAPDDRRLKEMLKDIAIIVIDDARVDTNRLDFDQNIGEHAKKLELYCYCGTIDVQNMPIIDIDMAMNYQEVNNARY